MQAAVPGLGSLFRESECPLHVGCCRVLDELNRCPAVTWGPPGVCVSEVAASTEAGLVDSDGRWAALPEWATVKLLGVRTRVFSVILDARRPC